MDRSNTIIQGYMNKEALDTETIVKWLQGVLESGKVKGIPIEYLTAGGTGILSAIVGAMLMPRDKLLGALGTGVLGTGAGYFGGRMAKDRMSSAADALRKFLAARTGPTDMGGFRQATRPMTPSENKSDLVTVPQTTAPKPEVKVTPKVTPKAAPKTPVGQITPEPSEEYDPKRTEMLLRQAEKLHPEYIKGREAAKKFGEESWAGVKKQPVKTRELTPEEEAYQGAYENRRQEKRFNEQINAKYGPMAAFYWNAVQKEKRNQKAEEDKGRNAAIEFGQWNRLLTPEQRQFAQNYLESINTPTTKSWWGKPWQEPTEEDRIDFLFDQAKKFQAPEELSGEDMEKMYRSMGNITTLSGN